MTAAVRLVFGSPLGLPSADDVRLLLAELGIRAGDVHPAPRQAWGVAKYEATEAPRADAPGQRLGIEPSTAGTRPTPGSSPRPAGSCCTGTPGPAFMFTRLQQVEHEAYLTLRAGQAGVAVPELVEAGTAGPSGDALLVCRLPAGAALSDAMTPLTSVTPPSMTSTASC